jgi:hypothetical protein
MSCWITERTTAIRASVSDVERTLLIAIGLSAAHQLGKDAPNSNMNDAMPVTSARLLKAGLPFDAALRL